MIEEILTKSLTSYVIMAFLIMLIVTYFSKKRKNTLRSKIFTIFQIETLILIISDILEVILYFKGNGVIYSISNYSNNCLGMIWCYIHFNYMITYIYDYDYPNLKEYFKNSKIIKAFSIFFIIYMIIYLACSIIVPVETKIIGINVSSLILYIIHFVELLIVVIFIIINHKSNRANHKSKTLFVNLCIPIATVFKLIAPDISLFCMSMGLHVILLYFFEENPDLQLLFEIGNLKDKIDKSNIAKSDFLANMSKEMYKSINDVLEVSGKLAYNDIDMTKINEDINSINNSSKNLIDLINNILEISRIESGGDALFERDYSLKQMVESLKSITESRLKGKNVVVELNVEQDTPNYLYGDYAKLYQALLNLLLNASIYTQVGKIKITITKEIKNPKIILHFAISDTGVGIEKKYFSRIFQAPEKGEQSMSEEHINSEYSLTMAKRYVELMDGKIWFTSTFMAGSTFYIDVEQTISKMTPTVNNVTVEEDIKGKQWLDCSNYKILIVEDDLLNLNVEQRVLLRYNFQMDTCNSGVECIDKIKQENKYDLIITDDLMPEMNGTELMQSLKKLYGYTIPPIVVLTANSFVDSKDKYLQEGFDDYLSKPLNTIELDTLINKYFKKEGE